MDRLKILREVAENIISKSENLNKKEGLKEFVECSNEYTLMCMLMGKNINCSNITEDIKKEIEDNFQCFIKEGVSSSILGMLITSPVMWAMWRTAKAAFSKAERRCGVFEVSNKRDVCLAKAKLGFCEKEIDIVERIIRDGKNIKDKEKSKKIVEKAKKKLGALKDKRKDLEERYELAKEKL